jgi:hypothetical protein
MGSTDEFLTAEELAERWRTTPAGIANMRYRGTGPPGHRIGRRVLYKRSEVEAFEASRHDDQRPRQVVA